MSTSVYPVRVDGSPEPSLNRWLWLVKWILVFPHYVVLVLLWLSFFVLSVVAFFAILFTGRYPRAIFDFNVGVLRWSWRVAYYAYGALATDRYPPFSLEERPDYPAHLEIEYPEHLSRGLVLVKWWLLALPHYLVVAFFLGGGAYAANGADTAETTSWLWGTGLIGLLVLVAAVVLLFTGRYPRSILDLVLGLNRWVLRVAGYAALMTDQYPPFRLDMGPEDPGSRHLAMSATQQPPAIGAPDTGATLPPGSRPPASPPPRQSWSAGRIIALVVGIVIVLVSGGLLTAGASLVVAHQTMRDDGGYFMTGHETFETTGYAISSESMEIYMDDDFGRFVPESVVGDAKLSVEPDGTAAVFVGIGPTSDVEAYLDGVAHTTVVDFSGGDPVYRDSASGGAPAVPPDSLDFWVARSTDTAEHSITWPLENGEWSMVVMNADGSAGVTADIAAGAELPAVGWLMAFLLVTGGIGLVVGLALVVGALRVRRS